VDAAKTIGGIEFVSRDEEGVITIDNNISNKIQTFKLLHVLEFDSDRKRMSVIIRDISGPNPGQVKLICKGADNVIFERLNQEHPKNVERAGTTDKFVNQFSKIGLRTLLIAEKVISEKSYSEWDEEYARACRCLVMRDSLKAKLSE